MLSLEASGQYIYIMENPLLPGMYKLGFSKDPNARLNQHSGTSIPERYRCLLAYPVDDMKRAEKLLFSILDNYRYSDNREFFECDLNLIIQVCNDIQGHINTGRPLDSSHITDDIIDKITDRFSYFGEYND